MQHFLLSSQCQTVFKHGSLQVQSWFVLHFSLLFWLISFTYTSHGTRKPQTYMFSCLITLLRCTNSPGKHVSVGQDLDGNQQQAGVAAVFRSPPRTAALFSWSFLLCTSFLGTISNSTQENQATTKVIESCHKISNMWTSHLLSPAENEHAASY